MRHYPPTNPPLARDNIFTVVGGRPYLVGTTCDQSALMTIDRAQIQTKLIVETTDPHLSLIDIELDRIGPDPMSNENKYREFLDRLRYAGNRVNGTLEVIRPCLEVSLDYELTSERTGSLVRKSTVNLLIRDRQLYLDQANPDPVDGPVLTNFIGSAIKSITDRAYGSDRLVLTLTRLTVGYQVVIDPWLTHRPIGEPKPDLNLGDLYSVGIVEQERYPADRYRDPCCDGSGLYRFEANGRSIWLQNGEINNPMAAIQRLTLANATVNKSFIVGGGHRVETRISVWTADETVVRDTSKVYQLLGDGHCHHPFPDYHHDHCHHHHHHDHCESDLMELIAIERHRNDLEECDIQQLNGQVDRLDELIRSQDQRLSTETEELRRLITDLGTNGGTTGMAPDLVSIVLTTDGKLTLPERAIAETNVGTKVTFNKFGVITGSSELVEGDIPELGTQKVTGLETRLVALENASSYSLPTATSIVKGGVTVPADNHGLAVTADGRLTMGLATALTDGAMAREDKATLDSLVAKVTELEAQLTALTNP